MAARISVVVGLLVSSVALAVTPVGAPKKAVPGLSEASQRKQRWATRVVFEDYDRVGSRNPKWDETARKVLQQTADMWGLPQTRGRGNIEVYELCQKAEADGCDDAMVTYAYARTYGTFGDDDAKMLKLHQLAALRFGRSGYSAFYKVLSHLRTAEILSLRWRDEARAGQNDPKKFQESRVRTKLAMDLLPELAKEKDVPIAEWLTLGQAVETIFSTTENGLKEAIEFVLPEFEKHAPRSAALTIKGYLYTKYAWRARGGGFANTVKEEGWRGMGERLEVAEKALEEAWTLDNTNSAAATQMITVELGQGMGRARMEQWFKRAMDADPDNEEACYAKLYYLEPKWYGTPRDMLAFGRECLKGGRWNTKVPAVIEHAHSSLSHYTRGGYSQDSDPEYFKLPGVWADYKALYSGYLANETGAGAGLIMNNYARFACLCGAWDDAAALFDRIGEAYDSRTWNREQFEAQRAEARAKAGKK